MGALRDFDLSANGERALNLARDRRAFAGDLYMRAAVMGAPSPADIVCLLDDAAGRQALGQCVNTAQAANLLQRMGCQTWVLEQSKGAAQKAVYDVTVRAGAASRTLRVQRFPQPHVVAVSA
jgi:hypothetical protein